MKIIAKTTEGFLITATTKEVEEILGAVNGTVPEAIEIGQKIPAIDYAATIKKLKTIPKNYEYKRMCECADDFREALDSMKVSVEEYSKSED